MRRIQTLACVMFLVAPLAAGQSQSAPPPAPAVAAPAIQAQTPPPARPPGQPPPPLTPPSTVPPTPGAVPVVTPAQTPGRAGGQGRGAGRGAVPSTAPAIPQTTPPAPPAGGRGGSAYVRMSTPEPAIMQNVRLDLTITDSFGTAGSADKSAKKTVTMIVVNEHNGRIRSSNEVREARDGQSYQLRPITINVDASPRIRTDGRVQLSLTLEYIPELPSASASTAPSTAPRPATVHESLTVLLIDGKPMLISQSADPGTDRRVTVEVTATIMK